MSVRSKGLLIALAVVALLAAAVYEAAPAVVAVIAGRALRGVVNVRQLQIDSVGLTRMDVAAMKVDNNELRLDAQHATIQYHLWPFRIRAIDVKRAELTLANLFARPFTSGTMAPALPPFPLRIEKLVLKTATPWGAVNVPVAFESGPGRDGGFEAAVRGPDFSASLANPASGRQTLRLEDGRGTRLLSLNANLTGRYPVDFDVRLDPQAAVDWIKESPVVPPGLKARLAPFEIKGHELAFSGVLRGNLGLVARLHGDLLVRDKRQPPGRLFESISLQAPSGYSITHSGSTWSGSGSAAFEIALNPQAAFNGRDPDWSWGDKGLAFSAAAPRLRQLGLDADKVRITASGLPQGAPRGEIQVTGLRTAGWPQGLPRYDVAGKWSFDKAFKAAGTGSGRALPDLNWSFESAGTQGTVDIHAHDPAAALSTVLKAYAGDAARQLEITGGTLDAHYHFQWTGKGGQTAFTMNAADVNASVDQMEIRGIQIQVDNRDNVIDHLALSASAPTLKLAAGVVGERAQLKLGIALPAVHVDTASIHLLGGKISIQPVSLDLGKDQFKVLANIDAVSLAQIIKVFDLKSTELTGKVSGPVRVVYSKKKGLEINQGDLHSVEPGVLKVSMEKNPKAASQFDNIAIQALEDFHYKELKTSLVYKPDGEYRITARIVGYNPNLLGGHAIALNPTITGRLPALFRAFFITGDFDRAIIETLQKEDSVSTPGKTSPFQGD